MLWLAQPFIDRPVVDTTSLRGNFQWAISFSPSASLSPGAEPPGLSIFTALREQLGLKLEPGSHPMDVLVIDSIEMPTPD